MSFTLYTVKLYKLENGLVECNLRQAAVIVMRICARAPAYFGPLPERHCDDVTYVDLAHFESTTGCYPTI